MKKSRFVTLGVLALISVLALLFTACEVGMLYSETAITTKAGGGTRVLYVDVLKDDQNKTTGPTTDLVADNSLYLIGTNEQIKAVVEGALPVAGAAVTVETTATATRIRIEYAFADLADYNAKGKAMATAGGLGEAYVDAALTVDGDQVTFSENSNNLRTIALWAAAAIYNDATVYDKAHAEANSVTSPDLIFESFGAKVTVGGTTEEFSLRDGENQEIKGDGIALTAVGTIADAATPTTPVSPPTGDAGLLLVLPAGLLAVGTMLGLRRRR